MDNNAARLPDEFSQLDLSLAALAQLSGLKLRSRRVVEGLLVGEHRGAGQGLAVEFAQLRPYSPGDELRRVDWKVYARTDKLHVRQYEEDVDLCVYILLDASGGMGYKGAASPLSKFEYAQILAGVNAYWRCVKTILPVGRRLEKTLTSVRHFAV